MTTSPNRVLPLAGVLPAFIVENTAPWEWQGVLRLLSDPREVRFVEVSGLAGNFFDASLDFTTGLITITPIARLDAEWFKAAGQPLTLELGLHFFMADGAIATGSLSFTVTVQDIDDTPPQSLSFLTGGSVRAGQPGATIGRLKVVDPDTTGGFQFRLLEGDAWQFEVVGDELRLRPGVALDLADGPRRDLIVEVSDGQQSAAFTLSFEILPDPSVSHRPINLLIPGTTKGGMSWLPGDGVGGWVAVHDLATVETNASMAKIVTRSGVEVWMQRPRYFDFGLGFISYDPEGIPARAWLAYDTLFNRAPTYREMASIFHFRPLGVTEEILLRWMLDESPEGAALRSMTNRDFVRELYRNITGSFPSETVTNNQTARLDHGILSRYDLTIQLMQWRTRFEEFQQKVDGGFYVPRLWAQEASTLVRLGLDWEVSNFIYDWLVGFWNGHWTLLDVARNISMHPDFIAKWGGLSHREYAARLFREGMGFDWTDAGINWAANALADGSLDRGTLLYFIAISTGPESPFRATPMGQAFDSIW